MFTAKVGVKTGTSGAGPMGPRIHMEILGLRALLAQDGRAQDLGVFGCQQRPWGVWVPTKTLVQSGGCLDVKYILYMMVPPSYKLLYTP